MMVLMVLKGVTWEDIVKELAKIMSAKYIITHIDGRLVSR